LIAHGAHRGLSPSGAALGSWVLMTVAMMGPGALAGVRHTGMNSLCWRRRRAMAEFSASYLAVWVAFGLLVIAGTAAIPGVPGWPALAATLAVAAAWQLTPYKRRLLRDCHRSVPLPPTGWSADRGALTFGLRNGLACLGSCWCLMIVMVAVPGAHLLWTAALTGVVTTERWVERPRRVSRWAAVGLGAAALGAAGAALLR
jgi:predicted metal-binding membrane protein